MMGTKNYANAVDLVDFARASTGTALRKISYGGELWNTPTISDLSVWAWDALTNALYGTGDGTSDTARGDAVTAGGVYVVTYKITRVSGLCQVRVGNTFVETVGSSGTREKIIVATDSTGLTFTDSGSFVGAIHNISVKEVLFDQPDGTLTLFNHPADVLRIDYNADGTVKGLPVEEQRTNLVPYSDFSGNWGGKTHVSLSLNSATSPTGQQDATIATVSGADPHIFDFIALTSGNDYTATVWLKGTGNNIGRSPRVWMLSNSGTITSVVTDTTPLTSEWRRYVSTGTCTASGTVLFRIDFDDSGSAASGEQVHVFGAQLEQGSFPTSYIPTNGSQAIRAADICSIDTDQFGYNSKEGTLVVEVNPYVYADNEYYLSLNDGTTNERAEILYSANVFATMVSGGVQNSAIDLGDDTGVLKIASAIKTNDAAACLNGGTVVADTSTTMPVGVTTMTIGERAVSSGSSAFNGHIKSIDYIPRRLTNEQLQELTS